MKISVVIPTHKRPQLLQRCLKALRNQTLDKSLYEVIVINDQNSKGPAWARNEGWKIARGEIIAFTDDDCIPDKNWLQAGLQEFTKGAQVVSGKVIVPVSEKPTDHELNTSYLQTAEFLTANLFCKRELLEYLGGFDESFTMAFREDSDFQFTLMENNITIIHSAKARVIHPVRTAPLFVSLIDQKKSLFNALLFKKHPQLFRQRIQKYPPITYYLTLVFLLITFVNSRSILAWLTFTCLFTLKRLKNTSNSLGHIAEMIITSIFIPPLSIFWRIYGAIKYKVFFV